MKNGLRLGIDLGGTLIKTALVDHTGRIMCIKKIKTSFKPRHLAERIHKTIRPWFKKSILGTGIGVAGDIDSQKGVVRFSPNLSWKNIPLKKYFQQTGFPEPLFFENDASCAAWGAYHIELKQSSKNLVVLTLGTGVGGGLILNGRLYTGRNGSAGELGHITIDPKGRPCGCGNRGCLETYMGGRYLVEAGQKELSRMNKKSCAFLTPKKLYTDAQKGQKYACQIWEQAGTALGIACADFINIFNPDTLLLCGGVAAASPVFLPFARKEINQRTFLSSRKSVQITVSSKNHHLGVIGAALLV